MENGKCQMENIQVQWLIKFNMTMLQPRTPLCPSWSKNFYATQGRGGKVEKRKSRQAKRLKQAGAQVCGAVGKMSEKSLDRREHSSP